MPFYELTMLFRSMAKEELVAAIKRSTTAVLNRGAVVTELQSLGHRDLPWRMARRVDKQPQHTASYVLLKCSLPRGGMQVLNEDLKRELDLLRVRFTPTELPMATTKAEPFPCGLYEERKPPAYRRSVLALRYVNRMHPITKMRIFKKTELQWLKIPKSFPIGPSYL